MAQVEKLDDGHYRLKGNLDFATVMVVYAQYRNLSVREKNIQIDLSGLNSVNSAALALLVELKSQASKQQQIMRFTRIPSQILDLARLSNVETLLLES